MNIDQTRYEAFWRDPDHYRLVYELNLVTKGLAYGLARGSAFHLIVEMDSLGWGRELINAVLEGRQPGPRGQQDPLGSKAIEMGWVLFAALQQHPSYAECTILPGGSEREFMVDIPGSPHKMVGRLDQIVERRGSVWISELKTANPKARYDSFLDDWKHKKQADFEIIGARSLGFDPEGIYVRQMVEGNPTRIWEIEEHRSDATLQLTQLYVHQTCEIIEMLRNTFTAQMPWPHICNVYPENKPGKCEHELLHCRHADSFLPEELENFKTREEHLDILKGAAKCSS